MTSSRWWLLRRSLAASGLLVLMFCAFAVSQGWRAFGKSARGARLARMQSSPQWADGEFVNPQPLHNDAWGSLTGALHISPNATPASPVPTADQPRHVLATPPASGLRVTWLGHSTTLVEIDGRRVLTDPVWSMRVSPLGWLGPQRSHSPPIALADLPPIDAVVISHDHYDHLDEGTITAIKDWNTTFVVPLGQGAHLAYWGVPEAHIVELDWWQRARIAGGALEITCTPARHASGRTGLDYDAKLWAGYALIGATHRVYYSGDTGLFPALREIGARLGPFDLTMIEVGQYGSAWPDWHLGPEQAVRAHRMVRGAVMLPVHWATFALAYHGWTEPIERAIAAASAAGVVLVVPRPGQSFEPSSPPPFERWWPELPWKTAAEDPIVASQMD